MWLKPINLAYVRTEEKTQLALRCTQKYAALSQCKKEQKKIAENTTKQKQNK